MITLVAGSFSLISRQASTPLPSGSRMSMTTTSGCDCSAIVTDSATVPASATTRKFGRRSSSVRSPMRTTSWSSTISILTLVSCIPLSSHFDRRHLDPDAGAPAPLGVNHQVRPDGPRPVAHVADPLLLPRPVLRYLEADAVVFYLQPHRPAFPRKSHSHRRGHGVPAHVVQRLLRDVEQRQRPLVIQAAVHLPLHLQLRVHQRVHAHVAHQFAQRARQVRYPRHLGPQVEDVAADIPDHFAQVVDRLL